MACCFEGAKLHSHEGEIDEQNGTGLVSRMSELFIDVHTRCA